MKNIDYSLYLVSDSSHFSDEATFLTAIETALQNGVTLLQLREKELTSRAFYERALLVKKLATKYNIPLIINDRLDIALAVNADGVHLGQSDLPVKEARQILGTGKLIGVSAKTTKQALEAEKYGADYLGTGAINPTTTKVITQITPISTLNEICKSVNIPVVAIGGICKANIYNLKDSKIKGVAVVSAILSQPDVKSATKQLAEIVNELIKKS